MPTSSGSGSANPETQRAYGSKRTCSRLNSEQTQSYGIDGSSSSIYRITYFPIRGRAEPLRMMLAYAGVPFEDVRLNESQWRHLKEKTPFGQLPLFEINGRVLTQSNSIARFLGTELGLSEPDNWNAAQLDALVDGLQDVFGGLLPVIWERDEAKAVCLLRQVRRKAIKPKLLVYEAFLEESQTGFFGSKNITWADFVLFCSFDGLKEWAHVNMKQFPFIDAFCKSMLSIPAISQWNDTHSDVPYCLVKPPGTNRKNSPSPSEE